jgi:hypothetical protein
MASARCKAEVAMTQCIKNGCIKASFGTWFCHNCWTCEFFDNVKQTKVE